MAAKVDAMSQVEECLGEKRISFSVAEQEVARHPV